MNIYSSYKWIKVSVTLFFLAAFAGLLASFIIAVPSWNRLLFLDFQEYRPLHTFLSLMALSAGAVGMISLITFANSRDRRAQLRGKLLSPKWSLRLFYLFLLAGSILIVMGLSTGREYFSWYPLLTVLLLVVLLDQAYKLFAFANDLRKASPEGFWLLGLGLAFVIAGLIESQFWIIPFVGHDIVKDLTVQWHGIDTFIAGMNALMYGAGVFIIQKEPKLLRRKWLYAIAGFSILFTFGHHHYVSPQPHYLKILAFLASMVAMVSFIRHLHAHKKSKMEVETQKATHKLLVTSIEVWTLVSIGSGVLFAIPQVNLIVHGTYFIVIHAMSSMIGVNLLLVFLTGVHYSKPISGEAQKNMKRSVHGINHSLLTLWIVLGGAGLIKGIMRLDSTYWEIMETITPLLYLFPLLGMVLTASIILGGTVILRSSGREADEQKKPGLTSPPPKKTKEPVMLEG